MSTLPAPPAGGFCAEAWERTADLQQAIVDHPFNKALADGGLERDVFAFYIVQDARYLVGFAQALSAAATRADDPADAAFLAGAAQGALVEERRLHAGYVEEFGLTDEEIDGIDTSPTCLGYTSYLRSCALIESYPVLLAAILPCFWVYQYVGSKILDATGDVEGHPYKAWITTYADEAFAASTETVRGIADRAAAESDPETVTRMQAAFVTSSRYEWMFWDAAYRQEDWPI